MSSPNGRGSHISFEYELGNPRRDPDVLSQLLGAMWNDRAQGGDGSSISPAFGSHLRTLHAAAQEFISVPLTRSECINPTTFELKPEWLNLLTLIFHCYFEYMQVDVRQDTHPDPLIDALLLFCDCSNSSPLFQTAGFGLMVSSLVRFIGEGLPPPDLDYIPSLLARLKTVWIMTKQFRLRNHTESVMPWSISSIKEGSLSTQIPASEQARIHPWIVELANRSEKLFTFPDMKWLGASHDGYPRYSSITSYVSARWYSSFTAYDNAALWQAALTFGVLEAITGVNIPEALLLEKQSDGTVVFTCRNITVLVYHWFIRVFYHESEDSGRRKHSLQTIRRAGRALSAECDTTGWEILNSLPQLPQNNVDDIICTLNLLLSAFYHHEAQPFPHDLPTHSHVLSNGRRRAVDIFVQKMVAGGWCPSLRRPEKMDSPQYWWYASQFKPFIRHNQREHDNCSKNSCVVHRIDESTYKTLHATPECSCPFLSPSINFLSHILESGRVPVISYGDGALSVHSVSDDLPYVAISHVWVDGLGSFTEKGLPTCQIKRIHGHVHELLGYRAIPAFWIDSLCIPENGELRNKAIVMMRQTYVGAAKVLVFDSSIHTLCSSANPVEENIFRISTSMWMQRVWTLQEALLARELHFEFSTSIASAVDLLEALSQRVGVDYGVGWVTTALVVGGSTPTRSVLAPSVTGKKPAFWEIMNLLFHRTTSKPQDEALAIAGLLNVNPGKILSQLDLESRIQTLFLEVRTLPTDLLFSEYKRMKTPGFRWCPTTLTSIGSLRTNSAEAICTPDGLTTKVDMLVLCIPRIYVLENVDTDIYVKVSSIGAFYGLMELIESLPKHSPRSFNAILLGRNEMPPVSIGTGFYAVVINIPQVVDPRDARIVDDAPLRCEYVMYTTLLSYGRTWDPVMEGHPMLEGQLIRARLTVT